MVQNLQPATLDSAHLYTVIDQTGRHTFSTRDECLQYLTMRSQQDFYKQPYWQRLCFWIPESLFYLVIGCYPQDVNKFAEKEYFCMGRPGWIPGTRVWDSV